MSKAKYAKVGDRVRIVIPKEFIRVGYPLCPDVIRETYEKELKDRIKAGAIAIGAINSSSNGGIDLFLSMEDNMFNLSPRIYTNLESAVISTILQNKNFGGNERSIYEKEYPDLLELKGEIIKKKYVKTGTRYPAGGSYNGYSGEYDYEPGGLLNEKTRCVYQIELIPPTIIWSEGTLWILADNCEKV